MNLFLWLLITFALCTVATYLLCLPGWKRWATLFLGVTILVPFLTLFMGQGITGFRILKTISVAAAGIVITFIRRDPEKLSGLGPLVWAIFAFNILQAAGVETLSANILNPIAGVLLCLAIPFATAHASTDGERLDWDLGWGFILAYTLWNLVFGYTSSPPNEVNGQWMGIMIVNLGVPLLLAEGDGRRWGETRVVALYLTMLLLDNAPGEPYIYPTHWFIPSLGMVGQIASLVTVVILLGVLIRPGSRLDTPIGRLGRMVTGRRK